MASSFPAVKSLYETHGASVSCQAATKRFVNVVTTEPFVGNQAPEVGSDPALQASHGLVAGLALGDLSVEVRRPTLLGMRTWVTATRCRAEFSRRSPLRESRCRARSPLVTSIGATPA